MNENNTNKIEELLAHHERQLGELNDVVTRQWDEIDALKKRMARMQGKIDQIQEQATDGDEGMSVSEIAARDKPPHY